MKLRSPKAPAGLHVGEYLKQLVDENPEIEAVSLMTYAMPPLLQARLDGSSAAWLIANGALKLRDELSLPFWDAAMIRCFEVGKGAEDLLEAALFHQPAQRTRSLVNRGDFIRSAFGGIGASGLGVAFCSELLINGESRFMPLIDFHCPESGKNDLLVQSVCALLLQSEVAVFRSGKSYHAYALRAVSQEELEERLVRALFFAPIIDRLYIIHQLIERCCALRISATASKPTIPEFKFLTGA